MNQSAILYPVFAMFVLTMTVLFRLAIARLSGVASKQVSLKDHQELSPNIESRASILAARNLSNLFEFPVFFYIISILFYVTAKVDNLTLILAWSFFFLRSLHSIVHITTNHIPTRFTIFLFSLACLVIMWIKFFLF